MEEISILEAMRDPQMRHAALVHLPVGLAALGALLALLAALLGGRWPGLRWVTVGGYLLLVGTALIVVRSGESAFDELTDPPAPVSALVEEHEEMAEKIWIFATVTGILVLAGAVAPRKARTVASWLGAVAGLVTAGWVGSAAHHGGQLVYLWGVGTPQPLKVEVPKDGTPSGEASAKPGDPRVAFFLETARPILADNCFKCHNPERVARSGNLDQTRIEGLLTGGYSGPAIIPGRPEESLLIKAVRYEMEDFHMPPKLDSRLSEEQIAALERWIREGAVWAEPAPVLEPDGAEETS